MFWSAADIVFVTTEIKLFEQVERLLPEGEPVVRVVTTLLVGYPILVAASGLWWRVWLVWLTTGMAMLAYVWLYLDAALWWHGGRLELEAEPRPSTHHDLLGGAALDWLCGREAGQANPAAEPVLRTPAERVRT